MEFPILYKNDRFWKISVENISSNKAAINIEYGKINGKITKTSPEYITKTIGKTTVLQRAINLAKTKWKNKITSLGFSEQKNIIQNNYIQFFPMKPVDYDKFSDKIIFPAFLQPKLDGVRMFALIDKNGELQLFSRQSKPIKNIPLIRSHLETIFQKYPNIVLDGELTLPNQKELCGILSRKNTTENKDIKYHIFDVIDRNNMQSTFQNRWKIAEKIAEKYNNINIVPTIIVNNKNEINNYFNEMVEKGFEGAIIRNMNTIYKMGKSSQNLQKIKLYFMDYFKIINYHKGKENEIIWEVSCLKNPNKSFRVKPKGTKNIKQMLYKNANKYIGKNLQVFFFEKDENGCVVRIKTAEDISKKNIT